LVAAAVEPSLSVGLPKDGSLGIGSLKGENSYE